MLRSPSRERRGAPAWQSLPEAPSHPSRRGAAIGDFGGLKASVPGRKFLAYSGEARVVLARRADEGILRVFRGDTTPPAPSWASGIDKKLLTRDTSVVTRKFLVILAGPRGA